MHTTSWVSKRRKKSLRENILKPECGILCSHECISETPIEDTSQRVSFHLCCCRWLLQSALRKGKVNMAIAENPNAARPKRLLKRASVRGSLVGDLLANAGKSRLSSDLSDDGDHVLIGGRIRSRSSPMISPGPTVLQTFGQSPHRGSSHKVRCCILLSLRGTCMHLLFAW